VIRATTHRHTDSVGIATISVDLALIGSHVAHTGSIAFALATCAKRTEARIVGIGRVAAAIGHAAGGCYGAFVWGAGAVDAVFACGALDELVRGQSKGMLKWIPRRMRLNQRTVVPQVPQLLTSFWVFTHVLPHSDGVGDAHAIITD
jgi:hypothetical protein